MTVELILRLVGMALSLAVIGFPAVLVLGDLYFNGPNRSAANE
jgi:Na+(H+)/acetate symporter ActP